MNLLVTGDWQVTWSNIDKCTVMRQELLNICHCKKVDALVHTGDFKHQLNPVDIRVINFGVETVAMFVEAGIKFYVLRGNHDAISMHDESDTWFPALKAAGAIIVNKPAVHRLGKYSLHFVPYYRDNVVAKTAMRKVAATADPKTSVMIFHAELEGCKLNPVSVSRSGGIPTVRDLQWRKYMFCLGGHIHMHQWLTTNTCFVGSPFAHDWGEANQAKGYLTVDMAEGTTEFIKSSLPRMYDPAWPGYHPPKSWKGQHVRVHVKIGEDVRNVGTFLSRERDRITAKYPKAHLVIVPDFEVSEKQKVRINVDSSDDDKVAAYVAQTCPDHLSKPEAVAFLVHYLSKIGGVQAVVQRIKLLSARAKNFLSFKELEFKYNEPGITVVTGRNRDWSGRSNGAGKTSFLQLPSVAFFGETLKGQKDDRWSRRDSTSLAFVEFNFKTADGKRCRILRQRKPVKLKFIVDGKDMSTGIGVKGTQRVIEQVTGLSWETLINAMYQSQGDVTSLLTGTDGVRKAIFSRFLNLDRFIKARDLIKDRERKVKKILDEQEGALAELTQRRQLIKRFLSEMSEADELQASKKEVIRLERQVDKLATKLHTAAQQHIAQADTKALRAQIEDLRQRRMKTRVQGQSLAEQLSEVIESDAVTCHACFQPVNKKLRNKKIAELKSAGEQLIGRALKLATKESAAIAKLQEAEDQDRQANEKVTDLTVALREHTEALAEEKRKVVKLKESDAKRAKWERQRAKLLATRKSVARYISALGQELEFLKYAATSFSQGGLPMYVAGHLCPQLNDAAKRYAELFSDGTIQVRFSLTDESVDVDVSNVYGGEHIKDQSQGELRTASLVVGFALREVMRPCNVMILDEPGESLDAAGASQFAQALKEITKSVGPILITSHNPNILAELANQRTLEIVKKNKCSYLKERAA